MKTILRSLLVLVVAFVLLTWWALEWDGVAILETRADDGSLRSTHVWYAEPDGELWVEAGTPKNGWYTDVQRGATVHLFGAGRSGTYTAQTIAGAGAHSRIRSLLREKYGFRDWWISFIFDTSQSIAVRMVERTADSLRDEN